MERLIVMAKFQQNPDEVMENNAKTILEISKQSQKFKNSVMLSLQESAKLARHKTQIKAVTSCSTHKIETLDQQETETTIKNTTIQFLRENSTNQFVNKNT